MRTELTQFTGLPGGTGLGPCGVIGQTPGLEEKHSLWKLSHWPGRETEAQRLLPKAWSLSIHLGGHRGVLTRAGSEGVVRSLQP